VGVGVAGAEDPCAVDAGCGVLDTEAAFGVGLGQARVFTEASLDGGAAERLAGLDADDAAVDGCFLGGQEEREK